MVALEYSQVLEAAEQADSKTNAAILVLRPTLPDRPVLVAADICLLRHRLDI